MSQSLTEQVRCTFCRGHGVDPFGLLSAESRCGCCGGRGTVEVGTPHVVCAYCQGSGSHKTYRCLVCGGAGVVVALPGPTRLCPECQGQGCEPSSRLICLRCGGRGRTLAEEAPSGRAPVKRSSQ